jgi:methyl-accepting chemotaxis protein
MSEQAKLLKNRTEFVGVDSDTVESLRDYADELKNVLPTILIKFYDHVKKWPNLASMFKDQSRMDHARSAQQTHWINLFSARFDDEYAQSVRKIGMIHSKIGLEPTWYIGAYAFTLNHLYQHAAQHYHSRLSPQRAQQKVGKLLRALNQCVMIDMDMAISIYLEENKKGYDLKLNDLAGQFETTVGAIVEGLSSTATELESSAESLASMADKTSKNAEMVAAATEEASANVAAVSSATEEMSASISHVENMANTSSQSSQAAVNEAEQSVIIMSELKEAIGKVNIVTDLITGIAEQTNLLALNATIEAARAGEAGKGFAVVANEVKALATQTAKATEDIRSHVQDILSRSAAAAKSIETVKNVILEVNTVSADTAESVAQQREAIMEIAQNIEQASVGTTEISNNIVGISQSAAETGQSSEQLLVAVNELAKQYNLLRSSVGTFISDIKSGTA